MDELRGVQLKCKKSLKKIIKCVGILSVYLAAFF